MASITWTWRNYWGWFRQLDTDKEKSVAMRELNTDNWLANLGVDEQVEVMMYAPYSVLKHMHLFPQVFKRMTIVQIDKLIRTGKLIVE